MLTLLIGIYLFEFALLMLSALLMGDERREPWWKVTLIAIGWPVMVIYMVVWAVAFFAAAIRACLYLKA